MPKGKKERLQDRSISILKALERAAAHTIVFFEELPEEYQEREPWIKESVMLLTELTLMWVNLWCDWWKRMPPGYEYLYESFEKEESAQ